MDADNERRSDATWARWGGEPDEALAMPVTPPSSRRQQTSFLGWREGWANLSHATRADVTLDPAPVDGRRARSRTSMQALQQPMSVSAVRKQNVGDAPETIIDDDFGDDLRDLFLSTRMAPLSGQMLDDTVTQMERSIRQVFVCVNVCALYDWQSRRPASISLRVFGAGWGTVYTFRRQASSCST